jgi:drug/metabolite transporter (DMT)-like permease
MIWGTSFLWIRIAVKDVGPYILVFFRVLFAFLGIAAYVIVRKIKINLTWRKLGIFAFLGFFNVTLPFILISWAEQSITSGLASVMNSVYPLFTLVFSLFFLPEERITWLRAIGLLIGFGGVVVLASSGFGNGGSSAVMAGIIAMLIAAVCYAASMVFARKMTKGLGSGEQSAGQIGMALVTISIATLLFEPHLRLPDLGITWIALIWLGLLGSTIATVLWFSLLNAVGTTQTSLVSYVFPVIAVILGIIFLGEKFSWQLVVGGIMVIGGVIWVNYIKPVVKPALNGFEK